MVMPNDQIEELYDLATDNQTQTPKQRIASLKAWKRYLGELPYNQVQQAIDLHNMTSPYPPRPAQLRIQILASDIPTTEQALIQAKQLTAAIEAGTTIPETHELVRQTLEQSGVTHDLDFKALYEQNRTEYLTQYLPGHTNEPYTRQDYR